MENEKGKIFLLKLKKTIEILNSLSLYSSSAFKAARPLHLTYPFCLELKWQPQGMLGLNSTFKFAWHS